MTYGEAPWVFTGRALYQLQLVPLSEAKKHIPPEFHIVSLFGYTLGGFYLARYDDSPCGAFDELVALAGIAWDPPVSAAWAAKVLVSSGEARGHGRRACGLPSAAASFSSRGSGERALTTSPASPSSRAAFDFSHPGDGASSSSSSSSSSRSRPSRRSCWWHPREEKGSVVVVTNKDSSSSGSSGGGLFWKRRRNWGSEGNGNKFICSLELPTLPRRTSSEGASSLTGPRLNLKLPSFSGATAECPGLLKYACDLSARVRLVKPVLVRTGSGGGEGEKGRDEKENNSSDCFLSAVLGGKPLLCLEFGDMRMRVEQPLPALAGRKKGKNKATRTSSFSSSSSRSSALLY